MTEPSTVLTSTADVVERARELVPILRERRQATEELRRLPDETVRDIRELGVVGAVTPRQLGGSDIGIDGLLDVITELARGCASTAWCAGNFAVHNHLMSSFPLEAQQEVFVDGELPLVGTGFSPLRATTRPEGEGAVVAGQWDFSSGIDFADWVVVVAMTERGPLAHLLPTGDVEIQDDTWHTMGLRGTGSKDVSVQDLFVPKHRLLYLSEVDQAAGATFARELYGGPFARLPLFAVFGAGIVGTILGTARGAVEVYAERIVEKTGGLSGVKGRDRSEIHLRLGKSILDVDAAVLVARTCCTEMRAIGAADRDATVSERVAWRAQLAWAAQTAHDAVERLFEVGGANSLRLDDQFGQFYRDNTAGSHHYAIQADTYASALGRDTIGLAHGVIGL